MSSQSILAALEGRSMQDPASELPRIALPRTPVNRGMRMGRSCYAPASMLERTVGIEPTPPYRKYGALQSCVRKYRTIPLPRTPLNKGETEGRGCQRLRLSECSLGPSESAHVLQRDVTGVARVLAEAALSPAAGLERLLDV